MIFVNLILEFNQFYRQDTSLYINSGISIKEIYSNLKINQINLK